MIFFVKDDLEFVEIKKSKIVALTEPEITKHYNALAEVLNELPVKRFMTKAKAVEKLAQLSGWYKEKYPAARWGKQVEENKPVELSSETKPKKITKKKKPKKTKKRIKK